MINNKIYNYKAKGKDLVFINDVKNKKNYNSIIKFLIKNLLKNKELFFNNSNLKGIYITIYDYKSKINSTGIIADLDNNNKFILCIDFNLKQVLDLSKNTKKLKRDNHKHLPNFNNFKDFLLFVLYHELGHYKLGHCFEFNNSFNNFDIELNSDNYSLKILGVFIYTYKQIYFNFYNNLQGAKNDK